MLFYKLRTIRLVHRNLNIKANLRSKLPCEKSQAETKKALAHEIVNANDFHKCAMHVQCTFSIVFTSIVEGNLYKQITQSRYSNQIAKEENLNRCEYENDIFYLSEYN